MCVILHGLRKKLVKREELIEAMRTNSAGFFLAIIRDLENGGRGVVNTVRSLEQADILKAWDGAKDDDEVVVHCRIPSRGDRSLDNVHGWKEDGIYFCHNMTISDLDGMMRRADWKNTDSEFFFRHVFIPFYRGCGKDAYRDGKFCKDLDNLVQHFCGYSNKFAFIMPDGKVIRYGSWISEPDRKVGDEIGFWASNASYRVVARSWPAYGERKGTATVSGFREQACDYDFDDPDGYYDSLYGHEYYPERTPAAKPADEKPPAFDKAKAVRDAFGVLGLVQAGLCDLALAGFEEYRAEKAEEAGGDATEAANAVTSACPALFDENTATAASFGITCAAQALEDAKKTKMELTPSIAVEAFAETYLEELAERIYRPGKAFKAGIAIAAVQNLRVDLRTACAALNAAFDFAAAKTADDVFVAFDMNRSRAGNWTVERVRAADVFVAADADADSVLPIVDILVEWVHDNLPAAKAEGEEEGKA